MTDVRRTNRATGRKKNSALAKLKAAREGGTSRAAQHEVRCI